LESGSESNRATRFAQPDGYSDYASDDSLLLGNEMSEEHPLGINGLRNADFFWLDVEECV
jgi:hypothetical protein